MMSEVVVRPMHLNKRVALPKEPNNGPKSTAQSTCARFIVLSRNAIVHALLLGLLSRSQMKYGLQSITAQAIPVSPVMQTDV